MPDFPTLVPTEELERTAAFEAMQEYIAPAAHGATIRRGRTT